MIMLLFSLSLPSTDRSFTPWLQRQLIEKVLVNRDLTSLPEDFAESKSRWARKLSEGSPPKWLASPLAVFANPLVTVLHSKANAKDLDAPSPPGRLLSTACKSL